TGGQKVARRPLLAAYHAGDSPPLLHVQGRGPCIRDGSGPNRGAWNSRSADGDTRVVRPTGHAIGAGRAGGLTGEASSPDPEGTPVAARKAHRSRDRGGAVARVFHFTRSQKMVQSSMSPCCF